jgi:hypothetical protein
MKQLLLQFKKMRPLLNLILTFFLFFVMIIILSLEKSTLAQQWNDKGIQDPLLEYGIVGSIYPDKKPSYWEVMKCIKVQRFLLELTNNPIELQTTDVYLEHSDISISDLLELRLIRQEGDRYFLNFALFNIDDLKRTLHISERYAESLAEALLTRRKEITTIIGAYDASGVDLKDVLYFLIECVSLDWDGLKLTAEKGYRKTVGERPDGNYVPDAKEITDISLKKIYWGSHTINYDGIRFTSFGDDHSIPRYMLPDLIWQSNLYHDNLIEALVELNEKSLHEINNHLGKIMLVLREGKHSIEDISRTTNVKESLLKKLLRVLIAIDYVTEENALYSPNIPVLTKRDDTMARKIISIGNQVMREWLADNYESIKTELKDLNFIRFGVEFSEGFTMIWHYIFGITNRKLVEAGLFADPYEKMRKYKGASPVVYELELR